MKIISIVNNKGGVGKTTSAQSIAAGLSKFANARVLVIDLDAQASLTKSFGIHHAGLKRTAARSSPANTNLMRSSSELETLMFCPDRPK